MLKVKRRGSPKCESHLGLHDYSNSNFSNGQGLPSKRSIRNSKNRKMSLFILSYFELK